MVKTHQSHHFWLGWSRWLLAIFARKLFGKRKTHEYYSTSGFLTTFSKHGPEPRSLANNLSK